MVAMKRPAPPTPAARDVQAKILEEESRNRVLEAEREELRRLRDVEERNRALEAELQKLRALQQMQLGGSAGEWRGAEPSEYFQTPGNKIAQNGETAAAPPQVARVPQIGVATAAAPAPGPTPVGVSSGSKKSKEKTAKLRLKEYDPNKGYLVAWPKQKDGAEEPTWRWEPVAVVMRLWKTEGQINEDDILRVRREFAKRRASPTATSPTANAGTPRAVTGELPTAARCVPVAPSSVGTAPVSIAAGATGTMAAVAAEEGKEQEEQAVFVAGSGPVTEEEGWERQQEQAEDSGSAIGHFRDTTEALYHDRDPELDPPVGLCSDIWSEVLWRIDWLIPRLAPRLETLAELEKENADLPEGWSKVVSKKNPGRHYYFHRTTRETRWERPLLASAPTWLDAET